jgi:hypothetical protein
MGETIGMTYGRDLTLVTSWNAIGPFDNAGGKGHDTVYPPETGIDSKATCGGLGGPVSWKTVSSPTGQGYVNLLHHFAPKDWVTVYALAYIHADQAMDAQLRVGSNDTVKVWLGGRLVWNFDEGRKAQYDQDIVPVHFEAGATPVLLKVSQTGGDWGFYFRITDGAGKPIQGVRVKLNPD